MLVQEFKVQHYPFQAWITVVGSRLKWMTVKGAVIRYDHQPSNYETDLHSLLNTSTQANPELRGPTYHFVPSLAGVEFKSNWYYTFTNYLPFCIKIYVESSR